MTRRNRTAAALFVRLSRNKLRDRVRQRQILAERGCECLLDGQVVRRRRWIDHLLHQPPRPDHVYTWARSARRIQYHSRGDEASPQGLGGKRPGGAQNTALRPWLPLRDIGTSALGPVLGSARPAALRPSPVGGSGRI
jgi:hypothetical protein